MVFNSCTFTVWEAFTLPWVSNRLVFILIILIKLGDLDIVIIQAVTRILYFFTERDQLGPGVLERGRKSSQQPTQTGFICSGNILH